MIAVIDDEVLTEDGEVMSFDELLTRMPDLPPTLFAALDGANLVARFTEVFAASHPKLWRYHITDYQRHAYPTHPHKRKRRSYTKVHAVHFFGFEHRRNGHYHKMFDPVTMYDKSFDKMYPGNESRIIRLLKWAITLRNFCAANNLNAQPTSGAISIQFLTDPRFYLNARRKVPAQTNATIRPHQPGHHYRLYISPSLDRTYTAIELDQHQAHHYQAQRIAFPHADHLYAYGFFHNLEHYYREQTSPDFMGLYCLDLDVPRFDAHSWVKGRDKLERQFVYTNELPHLLDMGYKVLGVRAAWGSHHREHGLNKFATWASTTLNEYGNPRWLKQLLLSTYGTLASRPTDVEAIFRIANRGEPVTLFTSQGRSLTGVRVRRRRKLEPGITNVLHRGMIEAATRSESVGYAQWLERQGYRILKIHADAVFIEEDNELPPPPTPEPWEVKNTHTHIRFYNKLAWESDQGHKHRHSRPLTNDRRMVAFRPGGRNENNIRHMVVPGVPDLLER